MIRAFKIELTVLSHYLKQMLAIVVFTCVIVAYSTGTAATIPSVFTIVVFTTAVTSAVAYDQQHGWEAYRVCLPLSRRDVVLGRYLTLFAIAAAAFALGCILMFLLWACTELGLLPDAVASAFYVDAEIMRLSLVTVLGFSAIWSVFLAVMLPVAFKYGQEATRWSGIIIMLTIMVVVGILQFLGESLADSIDVVLGLVTTPGGVAIAAVALVAFVAIVQGASIAASLRIYAGKDL